MFKEIIALIIGIMMFLGGIYYLIKEKNDIESRKIYLIASFVGLVITLAAVIKIVLK